MKLSKVISLFLVVLFVFSVIAYSDEEGKAIKEIKFLMKKELYENALVRANFYLDKNPRSLRVRKLKIDLLVKLSQFDDALRDYELFIRYSKAKTENIKILSGILVPYLKSLKREVLTQSEKDRVYSVLCEMKDADTIRELKEMYAFPKDRTLKIWAASLLVQVGKRGYLTYLKNVAKMRDLTKREKLCIIFAFASREGESLKRLLLNLLKQERDPETIAYIYWALTKLGESHRKELRTMLNRVSGETRSVVLFLLGELKDTKFTIEENIKDEEVLPSLYWAKYRKGDTSVLYNLRKLLSSPIKKVALLSIFYIGLIGDKVSIPLLRKKIVTSQDTETKIAAISSTIRIIRKDRINTDIKIKVGFSITL